MKYWFHQQVLTNMIKHYGKLKEFLRNEFNYTPDHIFYDVDFRAKNSYYFEFSSEHHGLIIEDDKVELSELIDYHDHLHLSNDGLKKDEFFNMYVLDELFILAKEENVHKIRKFMHEVLLPDLLK